MCSHRGGIRSRLGTLGAYSQGAWNSLSQIASRRREPEWIPVQACSPDQGVSLCPVLITSGSARFALVDHTEMGRLRSVQWLRCSMSECRARWLSG